MSNNSTTTINPRPFVNNLLGKIIICKLKNGHEFKGHLVSVDGYMNLQMAKAKEYTDGSCTTTTTTGDIIGDILIRSNSVLYIRGVLNENEEVNETRH